MSERIPVKKTSLYRPTGFEGLQQIEVDRLYREIENLRNKVERLETIVTKLETESSE